MRIIDENGLKKLVAEEGKRIRDINDEPRTEMLEDGTIEEYEPYYTDTIYLGIQIQTLEQAQELYIEE